MLSLIQLWLPFKQGYASSTLLSIILLKVREVILSIEEVQLQTKSWSDLSAFEYWDWHQNAVC